MSLSEYGCETNIKIANDVVGKIAAIAALEVKGVAAMGNNVTTELMGKVGMKNVLKNVKVDVLNNEISLSDCGHLRRRQLRQDIPR